MPHIHDMPFGATLLPGGGALCRLWAPATRSVQVAWTRAAQAEPELVPAQARGDGWWECALPAARAGDFYQWRLDEDLAVPDPASRSNPQGPHAPSQLVDPLAFDWKDEAWQGRPWHETVLYELHVGTFTPEGTFRATAARLPELAELGITAVELMPVANFPGRFGWGYDGVLPFAPHAAYGSPDDLKALVEQAHQLGLMVFLDVVYNHFGPDGNYLHAYAPQFFSPTISSPWGAAINFDGEGSRTVRDFFIHNALYWLTEFRFDGLRLDAVHAIVDQSRPDVLEELSAAVRAACPGRHVHLVLENEHNHYHRLAAKPQSGRFDGQWNDDFHHALHVALTGETHGYYHDYGAEPLDLLGCALSHGMVFEGARRKPGGAREAVTATPPQPLTTLVNYAHNHDQVGNRARGERLSELVPAPAALLPTLLALLTPAIPMLFQGEECGAEEPFLYFADWQGELREAVRAGRRREFAHAGDDLPDPCSEATFLASRPDCERASGTRGRAWQEVVHSALAARARWITPRQHLLDHGRHTHQRVGATGIAVQWRYTDGQMLALELNLGPEPLEVPLQHLGPVEAETVFSYRRPADAQAGVWPAWSVRWTLGTEITL